MSSFRFKFKLPGGPFAVWALSLTLALGLSSSLVPPTAHANSPRLLTLCRSLFSELLADSGRTTQSVLTAGPLTASELSATYRSRFQSPPIPQRTLDARRLINEEDWARALTQPSHLHTPWNFYGQQTMDDWISTAEWIARDADHRPLDASLLQAIHQRSMAHHFFVGAENRRIFEQGERLGRTREESLELARRVIRERRSVLGLDHSQFRGTFRSQSVDHLPHDGSIALGTNPHRRAFSEAELQAVRRHPYMRVDEASITPLTISGAHQGRAYYLSPSEVPRAVEEILGTLNRELANAHTPEEVIQAVNRMQKNLIGVHPFQDGNGRTVRLFADLIYQRKGLPPPLFPNEADLEMSETEALAFTLRGMRAYLTERVR